MNWKGRVSTATALCASSQDRWPFLARNVKKSLKMRLCVTTPDISATSIAMVAKATTHKPSLASCKV
ncbi:hypothetical protein D3C85_1178050 [compost metagenome]